MIFYTKIKLVISTQFFSMIFIIEKYQLGFFFDNDKTSYVKQNF